MSNETVSSLPKALTFTRAIIAKAVGGDTVGGAQRYAEDRWGANSRVAKAALPALNAIQAGGAQMIHA